MTPTLSEAVTPIVTLPDTVLPPVGEVIETVGGGASGAVALDTLSVTVEDTAELFAAS